MRECCSGAVVYQILRLILYVQAVDEMRGRHHLYISPDSIVASLPELSELTESTESIFCWSGVLLMLGKTHPSTTGAEQWPMGSSPSTLHRLESV